MKYPIREWRAYLRALVKHAKDMNGEGKDFHDDVIDFKKELREELDG